MDVKRIDSGSLGPLLAAVQAADSSAGLAEPARLSAAAAVQDALAADADAAQAFGQAWEAALLRVLGAGKGIVLAPELLAIPPLLERIGYDRQHRARWLALNQLHRLAAEQAPEEADPAAIQDHYLGLVLANAAANAMAASVDEALIEYAQRVLDWISRTESSSFATACSLELLRAGWFDRPTDAAIQRLAEGMDWGEILAMPEGGMICRFLLEALSFQKTAPREWNVALFERLALPWLLTALKQGNDDAALPLEGQIYDAFVEQVETAAHYRECFLRWLAPMSEAGRRQAERLPLLPRAAAAGRKPRIAFFVHNLFQLGHIAALCDLLDGIGRLDDVPFEVSVLVFNAVDPALRDRLEAWGITIEAGFDEADGISAGLLRLRARAAECGIDAMIWVCTPVFLIYAAALRLAPVQIWWSLKFHFMTVPGIDGYITHGGLFRRYREDYGQRWRVFPIAHHGLFNPEASAKANEVRAQIHQAGATVILGTLARVVKMTDPAYLDTVCDILQANPTAAFLWAGEVESPQIMKHFERRGVARQCIFIGWTETDIFAQVFDILLDTFPQPCARTALQAMAAGRPVLSREGRVPAKLFNALEVLRGATGSETDREELRHIFADKAGEISLLTVVPDENAYVEAANRLIRDLPYRERVGQACRRYCEAYYSDTGFMAARMWEHVSDLLRGGTDETGEPAQLEALR